MEITDKKNDNRIVQISARSLIVRFLPLCAIALASAALIASGAHQYLTFENLLLSRETLQTQIQSHHALAMTTYMLVYAGAVALSLPGALLLTITGGFLFGGLLGGALTTLAASVGATLIFLAARSSLGAFLRDRAGPSLAKFREGFERDAASYLLFLRLVPVFPFWLVNLAPALLSVPLKTFVWTTLVGILPGTFAYSFAGASLDSIAAAQNQAFSACLATGAKDCKAHIYYSQLVTKELIFAFAALGVVALIPLVLRRWRDTRQAARKTASSTCPTYCDQTSALSGPAPAACQSPPPPP